MKRPCPVRQAAGAVSSWAALELGARCWSFGELDLEVARWAGWLAGQGVSPGDRVGLLAHNRPEHVFLFHALARLGAALVPFNARLTSAELTTLVTLAAPKLLLAERELRQAAPGAQPIPDVARCAAWPEAELESDAVAAALFTSGTTGTPKLVELRHANFFASAEASARNLAKHPDSAGDKPPPYGDRQPVAQGPGPHGHGDRQPVVQGPGSHGHGDRQRVVQGPGPQGHGDRQPVGRGLVPRRDCATVAQRWLGTLPLFHIGGLAMLQRCAVDRATLVLEPGFEVGRVNALLEAGAVTHASLVPTTLSRLLDAKGPGRYSPRLQAVLIGGGPMGPALLRRAREQGLPVLQTYGLTEACSQVTTERPGEADGTTAGPPLPGLEVRVLDERGAPCAPGQKGEIQVRGATVSTGPGGWLATQDLGSLDASGRLSVWSRRVDLIVSGGENISPAELEHALSEYPLLRELAIVPRADALWGQVPVACVVVSAGFQAAAFLEWARGRVAGFKLPRAIVVLESLPRTPSGKLRRDRLRELVEA